MASFQFFCICLLAVAAAKPTSYSAPVVVARQVIEEEPIDPNPSYSYSYDVQDAESHDSKGATQSLENGVTVGEYRVVQPDGTLRIVRYNADADNGFTAEVEYQPGYAAAIPEVRTVAAAVPVVRAAYAAPAVRTVTPVVRTATAANEEDEEDETPSPAQAPASVRIVTNQATPAVRAVARPLVRTVAVAQPALHHVVAQPAVRTVAVARPALHHVVAQPAVRTVVAQPALHHVVAQPAVRTVTVAQPALHHVVAQPAVRTVVAQPAVLAAHAGHSVTRTDLSGAHVSHTSHSSHAVPVVTTRLQGLGYSVAY